MIYLTSQDKKTSILHDGAVFATANAEFVKENETACIMFQNKYYHSKMGSYKSLDDCVFVIDYMNKQINLNTNVFSFPSQEWVCKKRGVK